MRLQHEGGGEGTEPIQIEIIRRDETSNGDTTKNGDEVKATKLDENPEPEPEPEPIKV